MIKNFKGKKGAISSNILRNPQKIAFRSNRKQIVKLKIRGPSPRLGERRIILRYDGLTKFDRLPEFAGICGFDRKRQKLGKSAKWPNPDQIVESKIRGLSPRLGERRRILRFDDLSKTAR